MLPAVRVSPVDEDDKASDPEATRVSPFTGKLLEAMEAFRRREQRMRNDELAAARPVELEDATVHEAPTVPPPPASDIREILHAPATQVDPFNSLSEALRDLDPPASEPPKSERTRVLSIATVPPPANNDPYQQAEAPTLPPPRQRRETVKLAPLLAPVVVPPAAPIPKLEGTMVLAAPPVFVPTVRPMPSVVPSRTSTTKTATPPSSNVAAIVALAIIAALTLGAGAGLVALRYLM
jgi:hypothetical protein